MDASTSFKSAESWTPICLPKFNDTGFLHAHVSYLPNDSPACLLLFSVNKEKFFEMQECQQRIVEVEEGREGEGEVGRREGGREEGRREGRKGEGKREENQERERE